MAKYDHSMLVLSSIVAGGVLMLMGLARAGRLVARVPHSIVVGFTIGIAVTIAMSQIGEVLGLKVKMGYNFDDKVAALGALADHQFLRDRHRSWNVRDYQISAQGFSHIPAPLIALGLASIVSSTIWADKGLKLVRDQYGAIPTDFFVFTPPASFLITPEVLLDLAYFVVAIILWPRSKACSAPVWRTVSRITGDSLLIPTKSCGARNRERSRTAVERIPAHGRIGTHCYKYQARCRFTALRHFQMRNEVTARCLSCRVPGEGTYGLHRRYFVVRGDRHGEACRGTAGLVAQSLSYLADGIHGGSGHRQGLPYRSAGGDHSIWSAVSVL